MPETAPVPARTPSRRKVLGLAAWGIPAIAFAAAAPAAKASTDVPATEPARGVLALPLDAGNAAIQPNNLTVYPQSRGAWETRAYAVVGNFGLHLNYPARSGVVTVALTLSVNGQSTERITLSKDLIQQGNWSGEVFEFETKLQPGQQFSVASIISGTLYSYQSQTTWQDVFGAWAFPITAHTLVSQSCPS